MKIKLPPAGWESLEGAEIFEYGHLPSAAAHCRRLGVAEVVNHLVSSLWGDYLDCEANSPPPGSVITLGHQQGSPARFETVHDRIVVRGPGGPIFGQNLNGNSSDKTSNNVVLSRISSTMAKHGMGPGAFVYVADSALRPV